MGVHPTNIDNNRLIVLTHTHIILVGLIRKVGTLSRLKLWAPASSAVGFVIHSALKNGAGCGRMALACASAAYESTHMRAHRREHAYACSRLCALICVLSYAALAQAKAMRPQPAPFFNAEWITKPTAELAGAQSLSRERVPTLRIKPTNMIWVCVKTISLLLSMLVG